MRGITINNLYFISPFNGISPNFFYDIDNKIYCADNLQQINISLPKTSHIAPFHINFDDSNIIAMCINNVYMLYKQTPTGQFVELTERQYINNVQFLNFDVLSVPNGNSVQKLPLRNVDNSIFYQFEKLLRNQTLNDDKYNEILNSFIISEPKYFLSFQQVIQMFHDNQIESYIIDPIQTLKIFDKNGMSYLAKVRYDQTTNQILPPL